MANMIDQFTVRLYYGNEEDEAVGKHLARFQSAELGEKHNQIKELLYLGLQARQGELEDPAPNLTEIRKVVREELALHNPPLNQEAISEAITNALEDAGFEEDSAQSVGFTLTEIRGAVEAAVASELDRRQVQCESETGSEEAEDKTEGQVENISEGFLI